MQVSALVENESKKTEGTLWVNRNNKDDGREKGVLERSKRQVTRTDRPSLPLLPRYASVLN